MRIKLLHNIHQHRHKSNKWCERSHFQVSRASICVCSFCPVGIFIFILKARRIMP